MEKEILNASYCIYMIEEDFDRMMNVSRGEQAIADFVRDDEADHGSTVAYFDSETDARKFLRMLPAKTTWLDEKSKSRGTIRVIGYELWKMICNEDGEADYLEPVSHKFEPFVGWYRTERDFWDDGNK